MTRQEYDALPTTIKAVIPRNKCAAIRAISPTVIKILIAYDQRWDTWELVGERWEYKNSGSR